jgi:DNA-binding response OmpR family regulator
MGGPSRILIVDDDEIIRSTLSTILKSEGYSVDTAENGKEAIAKSNVNFYNLAIIDWRLPDTEGTKLLAELKETTPKMVKIMLTGLPSMQNAIDSVNAQADAFFLKPVDAKTLLNRIKALLKLQEQARTFSEDKVSNFIETRVRELDQTKGNLAINRKLKD